MGGLQLMELLEYIQIYNFLFVTNKYLTISSEVMVKKEGRQKEINVWLQNYF